MSDTDSNTNTESDTDTRTEQHRRAEQEKEQFDDSEVDASGSALSGLSGLFGRDSGTAEGASDDATPTPNGSETAFHDTESVDEIPEREPRRVELDMPAELGVYDRQRHRNGDETLLILSAFGKGWQAIAFDVDAGGQILETEIVGNVPTEKRAVGMCEYWMQANPNGVLGATEDPNGNGNGNGGALAQLQQLLGGGK